MTGPFLQVFISGDLRPPCLLLLPIAHRLLPIARLRRTRWVGFHRFGYRLRLCSADSPDRDC